MRIIEQKSKTLAFSLVSALLVACSGAGGGNDVVPRTAVASSEAPVGQNDQPSIQHASSMPGDWETWVDSEVARLRSEAPEFYNAVRSAQPRSTRAGFLRFTEPNLLDQPDALPLLLDRLINGNETDAVRAALAEAVGGTGAPYAAAVVDLLASERDPYVRERLVSTLWKADARDAARGLVAGLSDSNADVRAAAVYAVMRRADAKDFADALLTAAADVNGDVQQAAVQALGAIGFHGAKEPLVGLLAADNPELRFLALRALDQIDSSFVAVLPQAHALRSDPDPRVAKLAARLTE